MADAGDNAATPVEPSNPTKSDATNVEIPRSRFQDQSHQSVEEYPYGCWVSIQCDPELALLFRRKRRPPDKQAIRVMATGFEPCQWHRVGTMKHSDFPSSRQSISGGTRMLALIADPVAQARSPGMVNALLTREGVFGEFVLLPMHVQAHALASVVAALRHVRNFSGAIVSMPHKSAIVPLLDELTEESRLARAANVIRRTIDGRLIGTALDGEGFVAGLRSAGHETQESTCFLMGAGGAGASIAFALIKHGCRSLTIANRTTKKAVDLASRLRRAFPNAAVQVGEDIGRKYDIAINATCLGMRADDPLPLSTDILDVSTVIADCVISPEVTPLLESARSRGHATHAGVPMLAAQMELMLRFMGLPLTQLLTQ